MCAANEKVSTYFLPEDSEADWSLPGEVERGSHRHKHSECSITKGQVTGCCPFSQPVHQCR